MQWHQLNHMQTICSSLETDNHINASSPVAEPGFAGGGHKDGKKCVHYIRYNTIQYNTKFVKRHVAVASEALANRTVNKHKRRRTNVL